MELVSNILKAVLTANAFDVPPDFQEPRTPDTNELLNFWGRELYLSGCLAALEDPPGIKIGDFLTLHGLLDL